MQNPVKQYSTIFRQRVHELYLLMLFHKPVMIPLTLRFRTVALTGCCHSHYLHWSTAIFHTHTKLTCVSNVHRRNWNRMSAEADT